MWYTVTLIGTYVLFMTMAGLPLVKVHNREIPQTFGIVTCCILPEKKELWVDKIRIELIVHLFEHIDIRDEFAVTGEMVPFYREFHMIPSLEESSIVVLLQEKMHAHSWLLKKTIQCIVGKIDCNSTCCILQMLETVQQFQHRIIVQVILTHIDSHSLAVFTGAIESHFVDVVDLVVAQIKMGECWQVEKSHADDLSEPVMGEVDNTKLGVIEDAHIQPVNAVMAQVHCVQNQEMFQSWDMQEMVMRQINMLHHGQLMREECQGHF